MKKVFLSGVAGTGMSALAGLFTDKGYEVSGSDRAFYPPVGDILKNMDIELYEGYSAENIPEDTDLCVIGNIISRGNPEAEKILNEDFEYCSMSEALYRYFIKGSESIVAAGTHGKTTISSFVAFMLLKAGLNPGYFIGGKPLDMDGSYSCGGGDFFVSEGDEYETAFFDRSSKFLKYHSKYLILTSMEYDHLDFFPTEEQYIKSFTNLVNQVPSEGLIISSVDYPMNRAVTGNSFTPVVTYGEKDCDCIIEDIVSTDKGYRFTLKFRDQEYIFETPLLGRYNVWNLTSGIILGLHLGISYGVLKDAVRTFMGVERRMRLLGEKKSTIFLEDFAHHPTSIKNVINSLREKYPSKKIRVMCEPGSHSLRCNRFFGELSSAFDSADEVTFYIPEGQKAKTGDNLDIDGLKNIMENRGVRVGTAVSGEALEDYVRNLDCSDNNLVILISNRSFAGLPGFVAEFASE